MTDDQSIGPRSETMFATFDERLRSLHLDVGDIKGALKDLTAAITKLALIEERQTQASLALERAFGAVEKLEDKLNGIDERLRSIEKNDVNQSRTSEYVDKAIWAAVGLLAMFAASRLGLLG